MNEKQYRKRVEQAEYKAKLIQAEINAVKGSKAYKISKNLGIVKTQIVSDPVGLSKKAARIFFREPGKLRHLVRTASRGAFIAQSVVDQTAKYQEWILLNEPEETELNTQRNLSANFKSKPLISILTPVFNPPVDILEELIESVLEQTYPNLELCLGDFGDDPAVAALLKRYAKLDTRIKLYKFTENKGIAYNSNLILEKASGDYIALLDHDDTLSPDALYENVRLVNEKPYDFIYSDKDKIDDKGNRFDPLFKPELSPEMLLNVNYLTHLNLMRTSIVRSIGGWDSSTDGAQDWDIFLRVLQKAKHVGHIPKILYHWRVIESSTAHSIETKPYALAGQRQAIDKYLADRGIAATAYHKKTELLIRWDEKVLDEKPIVFIYYNNLSNTLRSIRHIRKVVARPKFVIMMENPTKERAAEAADRTHSEVLKYSKETFAANIDTYLKSVERSADSTVLFLHDYVLLPKKSEWYQHLTGWLSIKDVAATCGRLVDRHDLIVCSGGVITEEHQYAPLFHGYPKYYQSYIGNAEWVRNLSSLSAPFCATKLSYLKTFDFSSSPNKSTNVFDEYFLWLSQSKGYRLVMTPHATASIFEDDGIDNMRPIESLRLGEQGSKYKDKFGNPNMNAHDPMRLFEDEVLAGIGNGADDHEPIDRYQHDATILAQTFDINQEQMAENTRITGRHDPLTPKSVAWFLPSFDGVYAGLMNIFSFASYLVDDQKLKTTIYILKAKKDVSKERKMAVEAFPALGSIKFLALMPDESTQIATHDIGIATLWSTAYSLAKATKITRKCYFIQDNEANFYPKGSVSTLVELSYRFGFLAIANTQGLLEVYKNKYGGRGTVLKSRVDLSTYYPRKEVYFQTKKPYKVFFYARPNMPRNAFELGIAGLKILKQDLGSDVEIITAGAAWEPSTYGVEGLFTNLGKIAYEAVPKLYRTLDAGLMFMFSGHPGVTASELMASGCPVVVNEYNDQTWQDLYKHEETCLVTVPTASEIAWNLKRCLQDQELRKKLIKGGLAKVQDFYGGYEASLEHTYEAIKKG